VPSCAACDRYLSPASVRPDGTCPTCGRAVDVVDRGEHADAEDRAPFPWHFKVAVAALAIYLGWRAYEGVAWLFGRLF